MKEFLNKIKPSIPKRHLLLVATFVWAVAGSILGIRGSMFILSHSHNRLMTFFLSTIAGVIFFLIVFSRISHIHISRIKSLTLLTPCLFSFFNTKSYLLTLLMIGLGVSMRRLNIVKPEYLYAFFICMSIPLMISAVRFFYAWLKYEHE